MCKNVASHCEQFPARPLCNHPPRTPPESPPACAGGASWGDPGGSSLRGGEAQETAHNGVRCC
eukprot:1791217-Alexandrium_andersonii.AAC.1